MRNLQESEKYLTITGIKILTTLESRPVWLANPSRICLAGFLLLLYAFLNASSCLLEIVVLGLLLPFSYSITYHIPIREWPQVYYCWFEETDSY